MRQLLTLSIAITFITGLNATASAGDVTIKDVHLCCGACVVGANKALKKVDGLSDIACDRNAKIITFKAKDVKTAKSGIDALAKAGFHGKATHGGKPVSFPPSGAKKGLKADIVTFTGVHLCCGACVTAAQKAVKGVKGVTTIDIDRNAKSVTLKGKAIDVTAAVKALNAGGFHGTIKK